jgi:hypothetical protein
MNDSIKAHREPPAEWVRRLREISPISDQHSWLELLWHEDAERWMCYEMVPRWAIPVDLMAEFQGPDPDTIPTLKRFDPRTNELVAEVRETWITPRQWRLYQQYQCWARPCWVIQGTKGGHLYAYDEATKELCKAVQLPMEPPRAGLAEEDETKRLPYAPFDERVVVQLIRLNKLTEMKGDLQAFRTRYTGDGFKRFRSEYKKKARAEYIRFLESQMEEAAEHFVDAYRTGELADAPVSDVDWEKADDELTAAFIETGGTSPLTN